MTYEPGNKRSLATEADANTACINRVRDYLAHTGLSVPEFSRRVNYSPVTLQKFMNHRYHEISRSARTLVAAIDDFIAAHPVEPMTKAVGDLYDTENVRAIRETFDKLLVRPVAYMIYAPPGSQKSFVLEHQVAELNRREIADPKGARAFYVYSRSGIRPRDMMKRVAMACGCRVSNDLDTMLNNLRFEFRRNRVVLVVDEAQHLALECFEVLRELLDQAPYFSLLFAGSHDLKRKFDEFSATLEQWNSRIIAKVRLPGLERTEAQGIIEREIGQILKAQTPHKSQALVDQLVKGATVKDVFESNRTYINVRTLTNALDQVKAAASQIRAVSQEVA